MARTLPSAGLSPIDAYITDNRAAGYFEHVFTATTTERHTLDVITTATLVSGSAVVAGNFALTTAGTAAMWVSGIFAKVTQGSTKNVNGYITAGEFEVNNAAANVSDWFVLGLNANNDGAQHGTHSAYIALREYGSTPVQNLLWFGDASIGSASATSLVTTSADKTATHMIRVLVGTTVIRLLATTSAPS